LPVACAGRRPSHAVGVAHASRATTSFSGREFLAWVASLAAPDFQSRAVDVGHIVTKSVNVVPLFAFERSHDVGAVALRVERESPAVGVGVRNEPDAVPLVRRTNG
jgi:hypothetical protein